MSGRTGTVRILHVDDEPDFASMAATYLERVDERLDVETVTTVREGLDRLADDAFDCVVSDYDMPGRNGIDFLEAVRENGWDLPFILYTGKGGEEVASEAISAGVTDYLQKSTGTSQYEVLTNRITNAVEQHRDSQRATQLDRIRSLSSKLNRELIRAESAAAVKSRVCELISESDPYQFAWIGEVDAETDRLVPVASAGDADGYLEAATITTDESATGRGPGGTAVRERRIAVSQNIAADSTFEPWQSDALDRGFQAVAAIPLEYGTDLYGVLIVYADRRNAFDGDERRLLLELGRDLAHVLHSFDVETAARAESHCIERLLDATGDLFFATDTEGQLRRWNDQFVAATGLSPANIGGMNATDLVGPDHRDRVDDLLDAATETERTSVEAPLQTADGDRIPYEFTVVALTDPEDEHCGFCAIGRARSERPEGGPLSPNFFANLPGIVYRCGNEPGWPMQEVRGAVPDLTGYRRDELENRGDFFGSQLIHPDDRSAVWQSVQAALERKEPFELTYRIRTKDDRIKWVWEQGRAIYSETGEVRGLEGFILDVTKQERHKHVVDTLHDAAQSVMRASSAEAAAEIAVDTIEDVLDLPACAIHLHEDDGDGARLAPVAWTSLTQEIIGEPPVIAPGDGLAGRAFQAGEAEIHHDLSTEPELLNPDTVIRSELLFPLGEHGILLIGSVEANAFDEVDISLAETVAAHTTTALTRIEREQGLERQNERLEEFSSIVSHDLQSPLSVAKGNLDLYRETQDEEHLVAIQRAHDRMDTLLNDLLDLAREGADVTELEAVDLAELSTACWENVDTAGATLDVHVDRTIRADRSRLAQLLENLFRNAVEHGGSDVSITVGDLATGFYVADNGVGIPAGEREQILESGYSTTEEGTGFGLAIVNEIVDAHGWSIQITESGDGGARFEITDVDVVK